MKQYGFAINQIKLQRAIAVAKGDESKVYDLYVAMGGKVQKGYEIKPGEIIKIPEDQIEKVEDGLVSGILTEENVKNFIEKEKEFSLDESEEMVPVDQAGNEMIEPDIHMQPAAFVPKRRGRPAKNA